MKIQMIFFLVLASLSNLTLAHGDNYPPIPTEEPNVYDTISYTNQSSPEYKGVASAIAAAQHQFDWGTYSTQVSAAIGHTDMDSYSESALSIAVGRRFGEALVNGSYSHETGANSFGAAVNVRLK